MATFTSNYAWTKPAGSDPVDIGVLNNNLDSQDGIMHDAFLNMADPFSESSTYAVGNIVLYGTKTYRCRVAVTTAGSWTGATNWDEYKLSELTFDNTPTDGSNNPVKSDGIYDSEKDIYAVMGEMGATNLVPYPFSGDYMDEGAHTRYSIVYEVIKGGVILKSGKCTATGNMALRFINDVSIAELGLEVGKSYILSYKREGYDNTTPVRLRFFTSSSQTIDTITGSEDGVTFTVPQNASTARLFLTVDYNETIGGEETIKPIIRLADITDNSYHDYAKTNKQLTDEIANKVDKVEGKGLSTNDYTDTDKAEVAKVANKADKTATASGETLALVPTSEGRALLHTAYGMSTQSGTPTPSSPVDIVSAKADLRSVGKNLLTPIWTESTNPENGITYTFESDGIIILNTNSSGATNNTNCNLKHQTVPEGNTYPAGRYILSGCPLNGASDKYSIWGKCYSAANPSLAISDDLHDYGEGCVFEINESFLMAININVRKNIVCSNLTFNPMLRLANVTDSTYEPYTKHDTNTDLTLRAIEVTSSDAYNLVRDGKYYIADTLDYSEDNGFVVTRRVKEETITSLYYNTQSKWGSTPADTTLRNDDSKVGLVRCRCFEAKTINNLRQNNYGETGCGINIGGSIVLANPSEFTSSQAMNTWLTNNNVVVDYILATPTTETITTAQALALLGLKTYDESTTISSQAEPSCTVAIEYAKERLGALALTAYNMAKGNDLRITALEG